MTFSADQLVFMGFAAAIPLGLLTLTVLMIAINFFMTLFGARWEPLPFKERLADAGHGILFDLKYLKVAAVDAGRALKDTVVSGAVAVKDALVFGVTRFARASARLVALMTSWVFIIAIGALVAVGYGIGLIACVVAIPVILAWAGSVQGWKVAGDAFEVIFNAAEARTVSRN